MPETESNGVIPDTTQGVPKLGDLPADRLERMVEVAKQHLADQNQASGESGVKRETFSPVAEAQPTTNQPSAEPLGFGLKNPAQMPPWEGHPTGADMPGLIQVDGKETDPDQG